MGLVKWHEIYIFFFEMDGIEWEKNGIKNYIKILWRIWDNNDKYEWG